MWCIYFECSLIEIWWFHFVLDYQSAKSLAHRDQLVSMLYACVVFSCGCEWYFSEYVHVSCRKSRHLHKIWWNSYDLFFRCGNLINHFSFWLFFIWHDLHFYFLIVVFCDFSHKNHSWRMHAIPMDSFFKRKLLRLFAMISKQFILLLFLRVE